MRWHAGVPCRRALWHAATAAVLLTVVYRLSQLSDGPPVIVTESGDSPHCSELSIVCLADSQPAQATRSLEEVLEALSSHRQHAVLAGHSRLRQVFEQLQPLLGAQLRSRSDRPPPLADRDDPRAPPLANDSICLAAVPKLHLKTLWCSMAADRGQFLLDFRWRHLSEGVSELLERLTARPPDRLVLAHGLYQAKAAVDVAQLKSQLPEIVSKLQRLQRLGTDTLAMLEAGSSAHAELQLPWTDDSLLVVNGLLTEALVAAGVPLWSAHLPLVLRWLLTDCRRPPPAASAECHPNHMHTNAATNLQLAFQLLSVITSGPS